MTGELRRPLGGAVGEGTESSPRLVVECWLAGRQRGAWRVLLLRRSPKRGSFWQGVSGRVETTDEHLEAAARREIAEETGLGEEVELVDLGRWIDFRGLLSDRPFRKRSLAALLPDDVPLSLLRLSDEHDEARWVTFEEARRLVLFPPNRGELDALEEVVRARPASP